MGEEIPREFLERPFLAARRVLDEAEAKLKGFVDEAAGMTKENTRRLCQLLLDAEDKQELVKLIQDTNLPVDEIKRRVFDIIGYIPEGDEWNG